MKDNAWHRSISIPASALALSREKQERYDEAMKGFALCGRNARWSLRYIARKVGLTELPASNPIYLADRSGRAFDRWDQPAQDLTQWEPGEREYHDSRRSQETPEDPKRDPTPPTQMGTK